MLRRWDGAGWEDVKAYAADPVDTVSVSSGNGWQVDSEYTAVTRWGRMWWASLNVKRTGGTLSKAAGQWFPLLALPSRVTRARDKMFVGTISLAGAACPVFWSGETLTALSTGSITVSNGDWCSAHLAWIA